MEATASAAEGEAAGVFHSLTKSLGSSNMSTRVKSLRLIIKTWLPSQPNLSDEHMKKLWKGLFYCVWHADKLPVQSDLINRLSSLLLRLDLPLALHYYSIFLLTMRREWTGIDGLRLDKFYLLIRRFLHNSFALLKKHSWDLELSRRLTLVLEERTLLSDDKLQGIGVIYHIASVFLEELRPFLPVRQEVVEVLLKPFLVSMAKLPDKILLTKVRSNLFEVMLRMGKQLLEVKKSGQDIESGDDIIVLGTIALKTGFSTSFYELGSSPDCCQGNRRVLFALHEEFLMLEKDLASSGIELSFPDVGEQDEDEVPTLIPIARENEVVASESSQASADNKPLKKEKKATKKSSGKKSKKTSNGICDIVSEISPMDREDREGDNLAVVNSEISTDEQMNDENLIPLNESVISNLQMQFEKIAAEAGLENTVASSCDFPNGKVSKKRKRDGPRIQNSEPTNQVDREGTMNGGKSGEKSAKKVRFSMKNNVVWKPHTPLPPQSLRLPPSATPRGSALKKGVPPGPVREMAPAVKKAKKRVAALKKGKKSIAAGIKRPKKLKARLT